MHSAILEVSTPIGDVKLYQNTWENHIIDRHPEMDGRLDDVKTSLVDPDHIREGRKPATENLFVREYIKHDICVSTRFMPDYGHHIVTTAYTTESVTDSKGKIVWPK